MPERRIAGLGWVRDLPDYRDLMFSVPVATLQQLPPQIDMRPQCPPVYDQGRIGSCTANAIAGAIEFDRLKNRQPPDFVPSRLFIYYNERTIERRVGFDAGAQLRDGIKTVDQQGVCPEAEWTYDDTPAEFDGGPFPPGAKAATQPTAACFADAQKYRLDSYQRLVQVLGQLKGCLAQGYPFVFGFTVYPSFFEAPGRQKTVTPLPGGNDTSIGGHAVLAVGYTDQTNHFIIRNSWGPDQGENGYYYMPYSYLTDHTLSSDFWVIRTLTD
jgi:C1A family cysteine protease